MSSNRHYTKLDQICIGLDQALRSVFGNAATTGRVYPAQGVVEAKLTQAQFKQAAALMRVNHAGEVCAQALYHGQRVAAKNPQMRDAMLHAAIEEGDHLAWCSQRITELGSHTSYLNPFWYMGSFAIGLTAGLIGDKWSLGFLAETENQVVKHLQNQINLLPTNDTKSHQILQQMQLDEAQHRDDAVRNGAGQLPNGIKSVMHYASKIMVKTSYWF